MINSTRKTEMTDTNKTDQEALSSLSDLSVKLERMPLTPDEYTKLLIEAMGGKYVGCAFGNSGVDLLPSEDNRWAFESLAKMRSNVKLTGSL
jgi:hypothetical protein